MTIANNDIIRAACVWRRQAQDDVANVWYFVCGDVGTGVEDTDVPEAMAEIFEKMYADTLLINNMSDQLTHDRIELYHVTDDRPLPDAGNITAIDGVGSTDPTPAGVAPLLLLQTAVKRRVGRKFLPIFTEDSFSGDILLSGGLARVQALGDLCTGNIEADTTGSLWRVVVGSSLVTGFSLVTAGVAKQLAAYQRRRRPGRGS